MDKTDTLTGTARDVVAETNVYAVYAFRDGRYAAVRVEPGMSDYEVHAAIADAENNHRSREYSKDIKPGSFNALVVEGQTEENGAIEAAKLEGLVYVSKDIALMKNQTLWQHGASGKTSSTSVHDMSDDEFIKELGF